MDSLTLPIKANEPIKNGKHTDTIDHIKVETIRAIVKELIGWYMYPDKANNPNQKIKLK